MRVFGTIANIATGGLYGSNDNSNAAAKGYAKDIDSATGSYQSSMTPYMNSGAGLANPDGSLKYGAGQATAALPNQQMDVLGKVNDYLDPSLNYQIEQANGQIAGQYGNKGSLFSGAAGNAIADNTQQMAQAGWGQAWDRAMVDNNRINSLGQQQFQNQMGIDQFNNDANAMNFGQQFGINNQNFSNANDIFGTLFNAEVNKAGTKAELKANQKTPFEQLTPGLSTGANAFASIKGGNLS